MISTEAKTNISSPRYRNAKKALEAAGFDCINLMRGSKVVSAQDGRTVWLIADILLGDERIVLRWVTTRGVEVADEVRINIDDNCAAFVAALASVEVIA